MNFPKGVHVFNIAISVALHIEAEEIQAADTIATGFISAV